MRSGGCRRRTAPAPARWSAAVHGTGVRPGRIPAAVGSDHTIQGAVAGGRRARCSALLVAAPLAVAWWRRLQTLAWVPVLGGLPRQRRARSPGTGQVVPFALLLIALGTASLWMGYSLDWVGLRWPVAAGRRSRRVGDDDEGPVAAGAGFGGRHARRPGAAGGRYLGSIGIRTLVRGRNVVPFEVVQTAAVLLVGFGGALAVARATGVGRGAARHAVPGLRRGVVRRRVVVRVAPARPRAQRLLLHVGRHRAS